MMIIRKYQEKDLVSITNLFYQTVHLVNNKDYNENQINIWAPKEVDYDKWQKRLSEGYTLVAVDEKIVGFGTINNQGLIDYLYVDYQYLESKIATLILLELEMYAKKKNIKRLFSEVSITAKPFFEKRGYKQVIQQQKRIENQIFINYIMEKIEN